MAFVPWEKPMFWIDADESNNFVIMPETDARLREIRQPVAVVAIAGILRSGKSYLMNCLAGKYGFELGSELTPKTKGIWVWCVQHPYHSDQVLVLIDTEGLRDPKKDNKQQDMIYFTLAVLLSSTFVLNIFGKVDQSMIEDLHYVSQLTDRLNVKAPNAAGEEEDLQLVDFTQYFPHFILAVRDFTLELKYDGVKVTPTEYFEEILKQKKGETTQAFLHNKPRAAIRKAFKSHHAFIFGRPVDENKFTDLANNKIKKEDISPEFQRQSDEFYQHVLSTVGIKKLKHGQQVTGQILASLAYEYVKVINADGVPCIESIVTLVAENENNRLLEDALAIYTKLMAKIKYPVSDEELNIGHEHAFHEATSFFNKQVVFDDDELYHKKILTLLMQKFVDEIHKNAEQSVAKCNERIDELVNQIFGEESSHKTYACTGGFKLYSDNLNKVSEEFFKTPGKGVKAEEVWQKFLKSLQKEIAVIATADEHLSDQKKKLVAVEYEKKIAEMETAKKETELKEQKERVKMLEEANETHVKNLRAEFDKKLEDQAKENEKLLKTRLEEYNRLLKEGLTEQAEELKKEIKRLTDLTSSVVFKGLEAIKNGGVYAINFIKDVFGFSKDETSSDKETTKTTETNESKAIKIGGEVAINLIKDVLGFSKDETSSDEETTETTKTKETTETTETKETKETTETKETKKTTKNGSE